jgi:NADPH:quinone reductase
MKAVVCDAFGPPENLKIKDIEPPVTSAGTVKIRVRAAGVNFPDTLIIQGKYQFKPPLPFTPGAEVAGEVLEVGEGVTHVKPGDHVIGLTLAGGFAEQILVPGVTCFKVPDGMPFEAAAGFTMTYGTSHHALKQRAQVRPGETVLVLGAAGGVGLAAVELAKVMGAKVIAAASTDEKLELAEQYGADWTLNYTDVDLRDGLKLITNGKGVDVVYDPVGGEYTEPAFRSMAWNGRYLVIGFAAGPIPSLPLNLPLLKGASIVGVFWGDFTRREPEVHADNVRELVRWYGEGKLKPHVSQVFPLEQAADALRWVGERKAQGKVVIKVDAHEVTLRDITGGDC